MTTILPLSGWGRYPIVDCPVNFPGSPDAARALVAQLPDSIARGNGRSYGDASLNCAATLDLKRLDRMLAFDPESGTMTCEGGVLLSDLIDAMLPRGWFPPVTPGTKFVTIGGMIASDVHGKNHHGSGSFCDSVAWLDLDTGEGRARRCSATENTDLFAATCGGMGLSGIIVRAAFRMLRVETSMVRQKTIHAPDLAAAMALFEQTGDWTYAVAWIDCLARGSALGRSVLLLGEHATLAELDPERRSTPLHRPKRRVKRVPVDFPGFALSRPIVKLFNRSYYAAQRAGERLVDLDPYFYPLDALLDWNRIYGRGGFVQYQCVLPLATSAVGIRALLEEVSAAGNASFLAVLKRMGPQSFGILSFPLEGYTLALDFPATPASLALVERLDAITAAHGGRVYLAKDACMTAERFAASYPRAPDFRAVLDRIGTRRAFSSSLSRRLEI